MSGSPSLRRRLADAWRVVVLALLLAGAAGAQVPTAPSYESELKRAQDLMDQGDAKGAVNLYKRILAGNPRVASAARALYLYYLQSGNYEQMLPYVQQLLVITPNDSEARVDYARVLSWTGKRSEAIAEYQRVLKREPQNVEAIAGLARVYSWEKDYDASLANYRKLLKMAPKQTSLRLEYGQVLGWAGRYDEALAELQKVATAEPRNQAASVAIGRVLSWQGKLDDAQKQYDSILAKNPKNSDAILGKAQVRLWGGDWAGAQSALATMPAKDRNRAEVKDLEQEIAKAQQGRHAPAAHAGTPSTAGTPDIESRLEAAQKLAWDGKYDESIAAYKEVLGEQPENEPALLGLARTSSWAKHYDEAENIYRHLLDRDPAQTGLRLELARMLGWEGKFDESAKEYEDILKKHPDSAEAMIGLARVQSWHGHYDQASDGFKAVLAVDPNNADAELGLAQILLWKGDVAGAQAAVPVLQHKYPANPEVQAFAHHVEDVKNGVYAPGSAASAAGLADLEAKVKAHPDDRTALRNLGDAYQGAGRMGDAVRSYEALVKIEPVDEADQRTLAKYYSWNKQLPQAVDMYRQLEKANPQDRQLRMDLAKTLSWTGRYADAEGEYAALLQSQPADREARLGLARVESWDRQYADSLRQYVLLMEQHPKDLEVAVEQARVTAWRGDLSQAAKEYDRVLAVDPQNREALLGKAQVLAWNGRPTEAEDILVALRARYPQDREILLTWANVQNVLGRPDRAMLTLQELMQADPSNRDAQVLKDSIQQSLRPEMLFNMWSSLDSDQLHYYILRMTYSFNLTTRLRSFLTVAGIPQSFPVIGSFDAEEFEYGFTYRLASKIGVHGDVGAAHFPNGTEAIGGGGATFYPLPKMHLDLDFGRRPLDYIPTALPFVLTKYGPTMALGYRINSKTNFEMTYSHWWWSDNDQQNYGYANLMRRVWGNDRNNIALGYLFTYSNFLEAIPAGFFTPRRYQRHDLVFINNGHFTRKLGYMIYGTVGGEQFDRVGDPPQLQTFHLSGSGTFGLNYEHSQRWSLGASYTYLDQASPGASGAYRANAFTAYTRYRF